MPGITLHLVKYSRKEAGTVHTWAGLALEPGFGIFYSCGAADLGFSRLLNVQDSCAHQGILGFSRRH